VLQRADKTLVCTACRREDTRRRGPRRVNTAPAMPGVCSYASWQTSDVGRKAPPREPPVAVTRSPLHPRNARARGCPDCEPCTGLHRCGPGVEEAECSGQSPGERRACRTGTRDGPARVLAPSRTADGRLSMSCTSKARTTGYKLTSVTASSYFTYGADIFVAKRHDVVVNEREAIARTWKWRWRVAHPSRPEARTPPGPKRPSSHSSLDPVAQNACPERPPGHHGRDPLRCAARCAHRVRE
jgi:hypothetical protein